MLEDGGGRHRGERDQTSPSPTAPVRSVCIARPLGEFAARSGAAPQPRPPMAEKRRSACVAVVCAVAAAPQRLLQGSFARERIQFAASGPALSWGGERIRNGIHYRGCSQSAPQPAPFCPARTWVVGEQATTTSRIIPASSADTFFPSLGDRRHGAIVQGVAGGSDQSDQQSRDHSDRADGRARHDATRVPGALPVRFLLWYRLSTTSSNTIFAPIHSAGGVFSFSQPQPPPHVFTWISTTVSCCLRRPRPSH